MKWIVEGLYLKYLVNQVTLSDGSDARQKCKMIMQFEVSVEF